MIKIQTKTNFPRALVIICMTEHFIQPKYKL